MQFGLMIIGDEIVYGSRQDKHFAFFKSLLQSKGLQLAWVQYLPDNRALLTGQLQRSFADGGPVFVTGGIGATPDDHTRQAAAAALGQPLVRHPQALRLLEEITLKRGESLDSPGHQQRAKMADFAAGVDLIPNPFNQIAGFSVQEHYFFPGFPQMAHPMAEWVLDTYYADAFFKTRHAHRAAIVEGLPESAVGPVMDDIEARWPGIKTFSLPTIHQDDPGEAHHRRYCLEFGVKATDDACAHIQAAWNDAVTQLHALGATGIRMLEKSSEE